MGCLPMPPPGVRTVGYTLATLIMGITHLPRPLPRYPTFLCWRDETWPYYSVPPPAHCIIIAFSDSAGAEHRACHGLTATHIPPPAYLLPWVCCVPWRRAPPAVTFAATGAPHLLLYRYMGGGAGDGDSHLLPFRITFTTPAAAMYTYPFCCPGDVLCLALYATLLHAGVHALPACTPT